MYLAACLVVFLVANLVNIVTINDPEDTQYAQDLDFERNRLNQKGVWYLPYLIHAVVGIGIGFGAWLLAKGYFIGIPARELQARPATHAPTSA